jgi:hypothetical protein
MRRNVRASSFALGTRMLAINTMTARCHEPEVQRYTTPLKIVSDWAPNKELVCIIGKTFAGMNKI